VLLRAGEVAQFDDFENEPVVLVEFTLGLRRGEPEFFADPANEPLL
jgi:hypothetical protein